MRAAARTAPTNARCCSAYFSSEMPVASLTFTASTCSHSLSVWLESEQEIEGLSLEHRAGRSSTTFNALSERTRAARRSSKRSPPTGAAQLLPHVLCCTFVFCKGCLNSQRSRGSSDGANRPGGVTIASQGNRGSSTEPEPYHSASESRC